MRDVIKIVTISDASTAYNLELGFLPDYVEAKNATEWATSSKLTDFWWHKDMGDGYYACMENLSTVATNGRKPVLGTSNGFTHYDSSSFATRQKLIDTGSTKVTKATEAVVTSTGHGLSTGDKITFNNILTGMTEMNGLRTTVTYLTANTFSCDDIDSTDFTTWNSSEAYGQFIVTSYLVIDAGKKGITLGTDILSTNADKLIVRAIGSDAYSSVTQA